MKQKRILVNWCLALLLFAAIPFTSSAQDPSFSVYVDHLNYTSGNVCEFDIMIKASGATSSFSLRTFQAGIWVNPSWINSGSITLSKVSGTSQLSGSAYNGSVQWNNTDKFINCSVNTNVKSVSSCVSTSIGTTPVRVVRLRLTNSVNFACTPPDIKFNYVQNVSPLRFRTSVSWRANGCTTNYDMFYANRVYSGVALFNSEAWSATDADGKSPANAAANSGNCFSTLQLKAFIQSYYVGGGAMQPVLANQNVPGATGAETDTIRVELRDSATGAVTSSIQAVLMTDGSATVVFPGTVTGQKAYIAVYHRSALQTWSASPVLMSSNVSYDFTTAASKAFGDNQRQVDATAYGFFMGDLNGDEYIDAFDFPAFDMDNLNAVGGVYASTDMNGDGYVDAFDFPDYDLNNINGVASFHP